ncbi:MAG: ABC transporter permease [Christensenellaceae bacterium]|jgi:hypothetical protein|nr:ABC transporter permease [Christensenellaceae bacterium]
MIIHELKRLLSWRPIGVTVCFFVPLLILVCLVPGIKAPVTPPVNTAVIDGHIADLPAVFERLKASADEETTNTINMQLLAKWIIFGGKTDDLDQAEDIRGAYYEFYSAHFYPGGTEAEVWSQITPKYNYAKSTFMSFYQMYTDYMNPMPTIFINEGEYGNLQWGVDKLYKLFNATYDSIDDLNDARLEMNKVRQAVAFRSILSMSRNMRLTSIQVDDLNSKLNRLNQRRDALRPAGGIYYADFCNMTYDYISWHMRNYIAQNADFSTTSFQGFDTSTRELDKRQIVRLQWLIDNNKFDIDYSTPSNGLSNFKPFSIMHKAHGTTIIDFMYNASEIVWPALAIFAVFMTVFCIFDDIKNKTILGAIASKHSRRGIIFAKIIACFLCVTIVMLIFSSMFLIFGSIMASGSLPPPVLVIFMGKVISIAPETLLLIHFINLLQKLFLIVSFTAVLSILIAGFTKKLQKSVEYRPIMYVPACIFAGSVVILCTFLSIYSSFAVVFFGIAAVSTSLLLFATDRVFVRKEYL